MFVTRADVDTDYPGSDTVDYSLTTTGLNFIETSKHYAGDGDLYVRQHAYCGRLIALKNQKFNMYFPGRVC
jgi:hypothetical protein